jgi:phytoene dehydrogenase-like protein
VRAFASGNTASTMLAYLGKILLGGLYQWPGSGAAVTERLLARLAAHGERCVLRPGFEVAEVLFDDRQRAAGVRSADGETLPADEVLLDVDVPGLCRRLIGPPEIRAAIEKGAAAAPSGLSALVAVYGMTPEFSAAADRFRQTARLFWCAAADPYEVLDRREQGELDLSYLKVNIEREGESPVVYAEVDCTAAAVAGREDLPSVLEEIAARLERIFPGFSGQVAGRGALTPRDYAELSGNPEGTASGWRDDVRKPLTLDRTLERYGLTLVGQWSLFGSGLSQLELSAHVATQAVRRRGLSGEK